MTIKEIIKIMGTFLNREDVCNYISYGNANQDEETLHAVDLMCSCVNVVISELAGTYLPMTKKEPFTGGEIAFSSFSDQVTKIVNVYNEKGKPISYDYYPDKIVTKLGDVYVEYQYVPKFYQLDDKIGYTETDLPKSVLAFGAISELCLIERSFDESVMWRNRFVESLKKIIIPKNKNIKGRGWL